MNTRFPKNIQYLVPTGCLLFSEMPIFFLSEKSHYHGRSRHNIHPKIHPKKLGEIAKKLGYTVTYTLQPPIFRKILKALYLIDALFLYLIDS